jgi:hypothetical protein
MLAFGDYTANTLEILGGGEALGNLAIKLYDNVDVSGVLKANAQLVVLANDARLTDARNALEGSVVDSSVSMTANISQTKISNLVSDLAAKAPLSSPTFSGNVTVGNILFNPGRSYVFAQVTNSQNVAAYATYAIPYNTFTTSGSAIAYNSANGRFTVGVAGLYSIEATCRLANYASTIRTAVQIQKNGVGVWEANGANGVQAVATLLLAVGDYISIAVYNGGASSTTINTGSVSSATMRFVC